MVILALFACLSKADFADALDDDRDGFYDPAAADLGVDGPYDCDDGNAAVNPGAAEACNEADDDCDGSVDEDVASAPIWFDDRDEDGFGDDATGVADCEAPVGAVDLGGDCDDLVADVHPTADELCNGIDDDCDEAIDENPLDGADWYPDGDSDGFTALEGEVHACEAPNGFRAASSSTDCDDDDDAVKPGAVEVAGDGVDSNCDEVELCFIDADNDGFGAASGATTTSTSIDCTATGLNGATDPAGDCADSDASRNPGASEACDGEDDDCDGQIDEDVRIAYYADEDGDGFGDASTLAYSCTPPADSALVAGDCDDLDASINASAAEACDGADADEDCDGFADDLDPDGASGKLVAWVDGDGDGYGAGTALAVCDRGDLAADDGDCDDLDADVSPAADEDVDDALDADCDGFELCYVDGDADGYRSEATIESDDLACDGLGEAGELDPDGDCDDTNDDVSPAATEVCNGGDDDCDGSPDDGLGRTVYSDSDGDGYGDPSAFISACTDPSGFVDNAADCDDTDSTISPDGTEVCDDLDVDEDCDGAADDLDSLVSGTSPYFMDGDDDGFGAGAAVGAACTAPLGRSQSSEDCDDADGGVHPSAPELCDGKQNDCDVPWDPTDEDQTVSWSAGLGLPLVDVSDEWNVGTPGVPARLDLVAGTYFVCDGTYRLHAEISGSTAIACTGGATLSGEDTGSAISVENGGDLTLTDCNSERGPQNAASANVTVAAGSSATVIGGVHYAQSSTWGHAIGVYGGVASISGAQFVAPSGDTAVEASVNSVVTIDDAAFSGPALVAFSADVSGSNLTIVNDHTSSSAIAAFNSDLVFDTIDMSGAAGDSAVMLTSTSTAHLSNASITNDLAYPQNGGALRVSDGSFAELTDSVVSESSAENGGAIRVYANSDVRLVATSLIDCEGALGAAIHVSDNSSVSLDDASAIAGSVTLNETGAIQFDSTSTIDSTGADLSTAGAGTDLRCGSNTYDYGDPATFSCSACACAP